MRADLSMDAADRGIAGLHDRPQSHALDHFLEDLRSFFERWRHLAFERRPDRL